MRKADGSVGFLHREDRLNELRPYFREVIFHWKTEKPLSENRGFILARLGGFEPSTYRFVAGHSIR